MATNFEMLQGSTEVRQAHNVAYSVYMLGDIAGNYNSAIDAADLRLARCMVEAFYVHLRLLAEFLVKKTKSSDFGPDDFGIMWNAPVSAETDRLIEHWAVASRYVVHFGRSRVPNELQDLAPFGLGDDAFTAMAADALTVFREFLRHLDAQSSAWHDGARIPSPECEPEAWKLRLRAEQTRILRDAYAQACDRIAQV